MKKIRIALVDFQSKAIELQQDFDQFDKDYGRGSQVDGSADVVLDGMLEDLEGLRKIVPSEFKKRIDKILTDIRFESNHMDASALGYMTQDARRSLDFLLSEIWEYEEPFPFTDEDLEFAIRTVMKPHKFYSLSSVLNKALREFKSKTFVHPPKKEDVERVFKNMVAEEGVYETPKGFVVY
jgi:hypothetical protein